MILTSRRYFCASRTFSESIMQFRKWDQCASLSKYERLMFLKPSWAFECIQTQSLAVFETHAHPFISWEKLYPLESTSEHQQPLLIKELIGNVEISEPKPPLTSDLNKVHDLTGSPKSRRVKRSRPYDGDKDSQDRETTVPLFSPTKVLPYSHSLSALDSLDQLSLA
jgi:hypothetical protein